MEIIIFLHFIVLSNIHPDFQLNLSLKSFSYYKENCKKMTFLPCSLEDNSLYLQLRFQI